MDPNWHEYVNSRRGILIAPAGHGKTTAIADCLNQCCIGSCHLVLTHTHAGIASLKKKLKDRAVPVERYHLETITSLAQRYVVHLLGSSALPEQEDKNYFSIAVQKCIELLKTPLLRQIIMVSYDGVFVDEYQDCTVSQHTMIMALSDVLPTHILGDPLQGIFDFVKGEQIVDFEKDLPDVYYPRFELLNTPWRWSLTNNTLGQEILSIRRMLENKQTNIVHLDHKPNCDFHVIIKPEVDKYSSEYRKWLRHVINQFADRSCLILCPSYIEENPNGEKILRGQIKDRMRIKSLFDFANEFKLLDAIDGTEYYTVAKLIDEFICKAKRHHPLFKKYTGLHGLLTKLQFMSTEVNNWIDSNRNCLKRKQKYKEEYARISDAANAFFNTPTLQSLIECLHNFESLPNVRNSRKDFFREIITCMNIAIDNNCSVYDAMKRLKSRIRHMGRKIDGKCIGTTLLTKGLEFDTVILLDAEKFTDRKHLYVAISRARLRLVFITQAPFINLD